MAQLHADERRDDGLPLRWPSDDGAPLTPRTSGEAPPVELHGLPLVFRSVPEDEARHAVEMVAAGHGCAVVEVLEHVLAELLHLREQRDDLQKANTALLTRARIAEGTGDPDRELLGRRVREIWIAWAKEQPSPKPSWFVPWEGLSEPDREVDRRIGVALWKSGYGAGLAYARVDERTRSRALLATEREIAAEWRAKHDEAHRHIDDLRTVASAERREHEAAISRLQARLDETIATLDDARSSLGKAVAERHSMLRAREHDATEMRRLASALAAVEEHRDEIDQELADALVLIGTLCPDASA